MLLVCGVCGPNKSAFVNSVMSLSTLEQTELMNVIKEVMAQWSEDDEEEEEEEEEESNISFRSTEDDRRRLSYISTSRVSLGSVVEEENNENDNDEEATKKTLRDVRRERKEKELQERIELLLKREMELVEHNETLNKQVNKLSESVQIAEERTKQLPNLKERVATLRDEVDVLRPLAARVTKAETQLEKYKVQLEAASDVQEHASRLEQQQEEQMSEIVRLEKLASLVPKLEAQITKYKSQSTKNELRIAELTDRETEATERLKKLQEKCTSLSADAAMVQGERIRSRQMLDAKSAGEAEVVMFGCGDMSGHLDSGLSELNPEVHAKLRRLEDENEILRKRLSDESEEKLRQLKSDLDDSKRLAEAFRKKYRDAVQRGDDFEKELKHTCERLAYEETSHDCTRRAAKATIRQHVESLSMAREDSISKLQRHERNAKTRVWREKYGLNALGSAFEAYRSRCRKDMVALTKRCMKRVEMSRVKRRQAQVQCDRKVAEMNAKHKAATDSLLARYRQQCRRTAAVEREVGILREQCRHETTDDSRVKELEVLIEQLQSAASSTTSSSKRNSSGSRRRRRRSQYDEDEDEDEGISGDSFRVLEAELDSLRREKKEQLLLKARETQRRLASERELSSM